MMQLVEFLETQKSFNNLSVPWGFAFGAHENFELVLEWGAGGAWEKRRSDDAQAGGIDTPCRAKALDTGSALHGRVGFKGCRRPR